MTIVWDQLVLLIQVAGWRFDYFNSSIPIALPIINTSTFLITIVLTFLHCTLNVHIFSLTSTLVIYILSFFLYALTFPIVLGACNGKIKRAWRALAEHPLEGYQQFVVFSAAVFMLQGMGLSLINTIPLGSLSQSLAFIDVWISENILILPAYFIGITVMVFGFVIKLWGYTLIGIELHYYKDMFLDRKADVGFVKQGIFLYTDNPIYGLGNLQLYGLAITNRSLLGLVAGILSQLAIFVFTGCGRSHFYAKCTATKTRQVVLETPLVCWTEPRQQTHMTLFHLPS